VWQRLYNFSGKVAYVLETKQRILQRRKQAPSCNRAPALRPYQWNFSLADYLGPRCRDAPGQELLTGISVDNWHAFSRRPLGVKFAQAFCHRADVTIADVAIVDLNHAGEFSHCAGEKHFVDEMFCTGTMGELAGVVKIDNRDIGDGNVGPMTKRLSELYAMRTATDGVPVVDADPPSAIPDQARHGNEGRDNRPG